MTPSADETPPAPRLSRRNRIAAVLAMTAMWTLLWGELSWGNLIGGLAVATLITIFFPLPEVGVHLHIRPAALLRFLAHFARDLVVSSILVAWAASRPRLRLRNAVIAVRLRGRSDLNLTLTGQALTLIPGSFVLDARRDTGTLYIHVFDVRDAEDLARIRRNVLALETRIVRAVGSAEEVHIIDSAEGKDAMP